MCKTKQKESKSGQTGDSKIIISVLYMKNITHHNSLIHLILNNTKNLTGIYQISKKAIKLPSSEN